MVTANLKTTVPDWRYLPVMMMHVLLSEWVYIAKGILSDSFKELESFVPSNFVKVGILTSVFSFDWTCDLNVYGLFLILFAFWKSFRSVLVRDYSFIWQTFRELPSTPFDAIYFFHSFCFLFFILVASLFKYIVLLTTLNAFQNVAFHWSGEYSHNSL